MIRGRALALVLPLLAFLTVCACPRRAAAGEPPLAAPPGKVEWKREWDRFTPAEGIFTLGLTLGASIADRKLPDYPEPQMDFEVPLLDPGFRGLMRGRTAEVQNTFERVSNVGFRAMVLFPYVVDAGIAALGVHRNPDVAAQLFLIDLQSLTLAGVTQLVTSRLTSRTRPYVQDCDAGGGVTTSRVCGPTSDHRSFYSGHAAAVFTSAGLVCLHHQHIPLYGGGAPDAWACTWALTVASLTSAARIVGDAHWTSDVLVGVPLGWLYGYMLPKWLHYGSKGSRPKSLIGGMLPGHRVGRDVAGMWAPYFNPSADGGVLGVTAVF